MKTIRLYGHLGKRFGRVFRMDVGSVAEAIRALCSQIHGFRAYVEAHSEPGYRVLVGTDTQTLDMLGNPVGAGEVIKIIPVVSGASDGVRIIAGAVLIVAGFYARSSQLMSLGISLVLGGVAEMLSSAPKIGAVSQNGPSDMPAYSFGSPTVTAGQGRPVPLAYGQLRVGGAVVSAGIVSEGYQPKGFGGAAPDDAGTMGGNGDSLPWVWAIAPAS